MMAKESGKAEAQTWQPPATQTASKENFAARPFPEIARKEEGKQASLDRSQIKENQPGGMIDNINRSLASASPPAPLPILGFLDVQAKLTLGTPGDVYEQEADRVARQVVDEIHRFPFQAPNPRSEGESVANGGEAGRVQRQITVRAAGDAGGEISSEWEGELVRAKGGGQPMSPTVREPMERAFGADFGGVRVHAGAEADMLARSIQAKAFTTGQDVFFRQGAYEPGSRGGHELIAHELTHVRQQIGSVSVQRGGEGNNSGGGSQSMETGVQTKVSKGFKDGIKTVFNSMGGVFQKGNYRAAYSQAQDLTNAISHPKESVDAIKEAAKELKNIDHEGTAYYMVGNSIGATVAIMGLTALTAGILRKPYLASRIGQRSAILYDSATFFGHKLPQNSRFKNFVITRPLVATCGTLFGGAVFVGGALERESDNESFKTEQLAAQERLARARLQVILAPFFSQIQIKEETKE